MSSDDANQRRDNLKRYIEEDNKIQTALTSTQTTVYGDRSSGQFVIRWRNCSKQVTVNKDDQPFVNDPNTVPYDENRIENVDDQFFDGSRIYTDKENIIAFSLPKTPSRQDQSLKMLIREKVTLLVGCHDNREDVFNITTKRVDAPYYNVSLEETDSYDSKTHETDMDGRRYRPRRLSRSIMTISYKEKEDDEEQSYTLEYIIIKDWDKATVFADYNAFECYDLRTVIRTMYEITKGVSAGAIAVYCSDGSSKTGVIVATYIQAVHLKYELDTTTFLLNLREKRMNFFNVKYLNIVSIFFFQKTTIDTLVSEDNAWEKGSRYGASRGYLFGRLHSSSSSSS